MDTGRSWDVANPTESQVYSYDFINDLGTGETLVTASFALTVLEGTDNTPSSRLTGVSGINGSVASQRVQFLNAGVVYVLACTVTTSLSNTITLSAKLSCQAVS